MKSVRQCHEMTSSGGLGILADSPGEPCIYCDTVHFMAFQSIVEFTSAWYAAVSGGVSMRTPQPARAPRGTPSPPPAPVDFRLSLRTPPPARTTTPPPARHRTPSPSPMPAPTPAPEPAAEALSWITPNDDDLNALQEAWAASGMGDHGGQFSSDALSTQVRTTPHSR